MTLLDILPSLRLATRPRLDPAIWPLTTHTDDLGRLCLGGIALTEVADEFGTPTCVLDEDDFRHRARRYRRAVPDAEIVYTGRALLTIAVARWARDESLGVAVCSAAELATALAGGVDPVRITWTGTANTHDDLRDAVAAGIGRVVVENAVDIAYLAGLVRRPQPVLLRVTPDVDPAAPIRHLLAAPQLELVGVHCEHDAVRNAVAVLADTRAHHHVVLTEVAVGGADPVAADVDEALDEACAAERFPRPRLIIETGAEISAKAGVTLHRVSTVRSCADGRALVATDGDIRAGAIVALANRHSLGPSRMSMVNGQCIELPADLHPGDLLAVPGTGAGHGSASLVAVKDRRIHELIRRESTADRLARDQG